MKTLALILLGALPAAAWAAAPPPPSGLTATATGLSGQVQLSWQPVTAPAAVTGYHVYYATAPALSGSEVPQYVGATLTTVSGLTDRLPYWFFVASDEAGVGPGLTGSAASATPFQPPDPPSLTATPLADGTGYSLQWSFGAFYGSVAGGLRVESVSGSGTQTLGFYGSAVTATSVTLACGQGVSLQARVWDVHGSSSAASAQRWALLPCPPVAVAGALDGAGLRLDWTPASGSSDPASLWEVRSATGPGFAAPLPLPVTVVAASVLSFSAGLPPQGQGRWYRIRAVDAAGNTSASSNEVGLLAPPTAAPAATGSKGKVSLSWSAPAWDGLQSVTQWQVYYATHAAPSLADVGTATSVTLVGGSGVGAQAAQVPLLDGKTYWFSVAAQGGSGVAQVGPASATVSARAGLPVPALTLAESDSPSGTLHFAWSPVDVGSSGPATYRIYRASSPGLEVLGAPLTVTAALNVSLVAQAPTGTAGWYFVAVSDTAGALSTLSPTAGVARLPSLGQASLFVSETLNARVRLSWTAVAEAGYYQVYRATAGLTVSAGAYTALTDGRISGQDYVDIAPVNGTPNAYKVVAMAPSGVGSGVLSGPDSLPVTCTPWLDPGPPGRYATAELGFNPPAQGRVAAILGDELCYITIAARSDGKVYLSWAAARQGSYAVSEYRVYRGWSAAGLTAVASVLVTSTAWTDASPPPPLSALYYGVTAVDQRGNASRRITGTVGAVAAWPAPSSAAATVLAGGVRLSWASPTGSGTYPLSGYEVSRRWTAQASYLPLTVVAGLQYTDLAPDASQGNQPGYRIRVQDSDGGHGAGATLTATLSSAAPVTTVSTVTGVVASALALAGDPVQVGWEPAPVAESISSWLVWRNDVGLLTETASLGWLDTATSAGSVYQYKVQARAVSGALGASATAQPAWVQALPPQPASLTIVAAIDPSWEGTSHALRLAWQDQGVPLSVTAYSVYSWAGGFTDLTLATVEAQNLTVAAAAIGVSPSQTVAFAVLAHASGDPWPLTPAALSLTEPPLPGAVTGLTATPLSAGAALRWGAATGAVEYWVFRSTSAWGSEPPVADRIARVAAAALTDTGLATDAPLNYAVCAVNGLGRDAASYLVVSPLAKAPTSLTAQPGYGAGAQVSLSWLSSPPAGPATRYRVWRATDGATFTLLTDTALSAYTDTTSTATPLPLATPLLYGVSVVDLGESARLLTDTVRAYGLPASPTALAAVGAPGAVDIAWSPNGAADGVTGYALSLFFNGVTSSALVAAPGTGYRVTGLSAGSAVYASATALNSAGASPFSVSVAARANAVGSAAQPAYLSATVGFAESVSTQASVVLSWSAPGAGSVEIYRAQGFLPLSGAAGGPASPYWLQSLGGTSSRLTDTGVTEKLPYSYAVTAVSADGLPGGESAPLFTGQVVPYREPLPVGLSATAGFGRVDLRWSEAPLAGSYPAQAKPYRLHRQKTASDPGTLAGVVDDPGFPLDLSGTSYADLDVVNGATYFYFLSQVDDQGHETRDGAYPRLSTSGSSAAPQRPQGPRPPPSPIETVAGDRSATFRWLAPDTEASVDVHYNVYRRLTVTGSDYGEPLPALYMVGHSISEFVQVNKILISIRDATAVNKQGYYYCIAAVNEWGEGPRSPEIPVTPHKPLDPGAGNRTVAVEIVGKKNVSLTWGATVTDPAYLAEGYPLDHYAVYRSQDGGSTYTLVQDKLTVTHWVDDTTSFGSAYTYRVVPVDDHGFDGYAYNLQTVVIPPGVDSILLFRNAFNPAVGETLPVQFAVQREGHVWIKVFTLNGEYVATLFDEEVKGVNADNPFLSERRLWDGRNVDGHLVASGVYLVHMEGPSFRANARVAVIK